MQHPLTDHRKKLKYKMKTKAAHVISTAFKHLNLSLKSFMNLKSHSDYCTVQVTCFNIQKLCTLSTPLIQECHSYDSKKKRRL